MERSTEAVRRSKEKKRDGRRDSGAASALRGLFTLMEKCCSVRAVGGPEDLLRLLEARKRPDNIYKASTASNGLQGTGNENSKTAQDATRLEECASARILRRYSPTRRIIEEVVFDYDTMPKGFEQERERCWFAGMACFRGPVELEYERTFLKVTRAKRVLEKDLALLLIRLGSVDCSDQTTIQVPAIIRYSSLENDVERRNQNLWMNLGNSHLPPNDDCWCSLVNYNNERAGLDAFIRDAAYALKISNKAIENRKKRAFKSPSDSITEIALRTLAQAEKKTGPFALLGKGNRKDAGGNRKGSLFLKKTDPEINCKESRIRTVLTGRVPFTLRHLGAILMSATTMATQSNGPREIMPSVTSAQICARKNKSATQDQSPSKLANEPSSGAIVDNFSDNWMNLSESRWPQQMERTAKLFNNDTCISSLLNIHSGNMLCAKCVHSILEGANKAPGENGKPNVPPKMVIRPPKFTNESCMDKYNQEQCIQSRRSSLVNLKLQLFKKWVELKIEQESFAVRHELNMIEYGFNKSMFGQISAGCIEEICMADGLAETALRFEQWWKECIYDRLTDAWRPHVISPQYKFKPAAGSKSAIESHDFPNLEVSTDGAPEPSGKGPNNVLYIGGLLASVSYGIDLFREFVSTIEYIRLQQANLDGNARASQASNSKGLRTTYKIAETAPIRIEQADILASPFVDEEEAFSVSRTPVDFSKNRMATEPLGKRRHMMIRRAGVVTLDGCIFTPYWTRPKSSMPSKMCPKYNYQSFSGGFVLNQRCAQLSQCTPNSELQAHMKSLSDPLRWITDDPKSKEPLEKEETAKEILAIADILRKLPKEVVPRSNNDFYGDIKPRVASKVNVYIKGGAEAIKILYDLCSLLRTVCAMTLIQFCWDSLLPMSDELDGVKLEKRLKLIWEKGTYLEDLFQSNNHNLDELWCSSYDELFASLSGPFGQDIDTLWRISLNLKLDIDEKSVDQRITALKHKIFYVWSRVCRRRPKDCSEFQFLEIVEEELFLISLGSLAPNDKYLNQFHNSWNAVGHEVFNIRSKEHD